MGGNKISEYSGFKIEKQDEKSLIALVCLEEACTKSTMLIKCMPRANSSRVSFFCISVTRVHLLLGCK